MNETRRLLKILRMGTSEKDNGFQKMIELRDLRYLESRDPFNPVHSST